MKNFKLNQAVFGVSKGSNVVKCKLVKTALSTGLVFGSIFGLTGCSGNNDKPAEIQTPTEDVLEPVAPEKTPEELEIEQLQDWQEVDRDYDNSILERYNKIMGYVYSVTRGADQHESITLVSPDDQEGMAKLQSDGEKYVLIRRQILPCRFVYSAISKQWLKTYPDQPEGTIGESLYKAVDDKYIYISDEELDEIFGKEEGKIQHFDLEKSNDKVKTR